MNFIKYILKIKGWPLEEANSALQKIKHLSDNEFLILQERKKWEIFDYHTKNNERYSEFIGKQKPEKWEDIPIMTKRSIQVPIKQKLSKDYINKKIYINHTSGSTGTPFYFAKDLYSHALTWAVISDRFQWHGIDIFKDKQARFYGIPFSLIPRIKERIKDIAMNRVRLDVLDPSDKVQYKTLLQLKKGNYKYINGYSRSLTVFSKYLLKTKIILKELCPSIRACIVTSGILTIEDREMIVEALGIPVINEYGVSEISLIAFEDKDFDWLISDEEIYVEIVNDEGEILPPGVEGRLIITSLNNRAMPFIRYDVGDIAVLAEQRKGKYSVLKSLIGRSNDYLLLRNGEKVSVAILEHAIKPVLANNYGLKEYLIRQWAYNKFTFEYVADEELDDSKKTIAISTLEKYLNHPVIFVFTKLDSIKRTNSWKLKYFERMF